jgi:hypothetical protein
MNNTKNTKTKYKLNEIVYYVDDFFADVGYATSYMIRKVKIIKIIPLSKERPYQKEIRYVANYLNVTNDTYPYLLTNSSMFKTIQDAQQLLKKTIKDHSGRLLEHLNKEQDRINKEIEFHKKQLESIQ